ncbi:MAG: metallophosphoesterase [Chloroflexi bacterium]|nr:metallophosphoesterase [Chloroflexota bacterium]
MPRILHVMLAGLLAFLAACAGQTTPTPPSTQTAVSLPTASPTARALPTATAPPPTPTETTPTEPTPTNPQARFAIIGDYGTGDANAAAVAALVLAWQPEFIVTTGDNNYPNGAAETIDPNIGQFYSDYIGGYAGEYGEGSEVNRFFPTLGNHDWDTPGAQPYLDYFNLPGHERYYDFVWGPVHFFMLDSDSREPDGIGRSSRQAEWLKAGLAASTAPWQVVVLHHPPFSSGRHGDNPPLQWPYAGWGADLLLAGHDHLYERLEIAGLTHVTNGLGGGSRYYFIVPLPESLARYRAAHGALFISASPEGMDIEFVNVNGEVVDAFTLAQED